MTGEKTGGSKGMVIAGWVLSVLPGAALAMSSVGKFMRGTQVVEGFKKFGYPDNTILPLAIVELCCAVLFLIPRTAVLGAILLTGYMGGAIATHVRMGEMFLVQSLLPVMAWLGLYLRDRRIREVLPIRK